MGPAGAGRTTNEKVPGLFSEGKNRPGTFLFGRREKTRYLLMPRGDTERGHVVGKSLPEQGASADHLRRIQVTGPEKLPFRALSARERRPILGATMIGAAVAIPIVVFVSYLSLFFSVLLPSMLPKGLGGSHYFLWWAANVGIVALGFVAVRIASRKLMTDGRAHMELDALAVLARDPRPPILYLRSFNDDDIPDLNGWKIQLGTTLTVEMSLAKALRNIGPLVSIGRPGEKLPKLGSSRFYVADTDWKQAVLHFLDNAQAVIIVVGSSRGVAWEIEAALARRDKVVFLFPFIMPKSRRSSTKMAWEALRQGKQDRLSAGLMADIVQQRHSRYSEFRRRIAATCGIELPEDLRGNIAIQFSDGQTPTILETVQPTNLPRMRDEQGVTVDYARTLRPFFDRLQNRRTEPDSVERFYSNGPLVTWLARLLWVASIIAFVSMISAAGDMLLGQGQRAFWPVGIRLVGCLVCGNLAHFLTVLARRIRAQEQRLGG